MCTSPASRTASYISRTSPLLIPSGFSHMTCLPCLAAARAIGLWVEVGGAVMTAADPGVGTDRLGVGRDVGDAPVGLPAFQERRVGVAGGGQLGPGVEPDRRDVV